MKGFDDPRGKLWYDTLRVVRLNDPNAFIFENVKGLADPRNKENLLLLLDSFRKIGYKVRHTILNSYEFGLPQNRERVFIVGIKKDLFPVDGFHFPNSVDKKPYLYEIIDGIGKNEINLNKTKMEPNVLFEGKIPMARNKFQKLDEMNDFFVFCDTRNGHTTIHSWDIIRTSKREKEICMAVLKNRRKKKYGQKDGNPISYKHLCRLIPDLQEQELEKLVVKNILRRVPSSGYEFVNSKNSAGINSIYRVYLPHSNIFSTLTATGTKDVVALKSINAKTKEEYREKFLREIVRPNKFRQITSKEAGRLQGFPNWFIFHSDMKFAMKQFGNAVSVPVVKALGKEVLQAINVNESVL